jgi:hypothetical protein
VTICQQAEELVPHLRACVLSNIDRDLLMHAQTSRIKLSVIGQGFLLKMIITCEKPTCKDVVVCSEKLDMYYMSPNVFYMCPDMCITLVPVCIACRDTYDTHPGTYNPYRKCSTQQAGRNKTHRGRHVDIATHRKRCM